MPRKPLLLVAIALCTALGLLADLGWRAYTSPKYAVMVDGTVIGALRLPATAQEALDAVMAEIPDEMKPQVHLEEKLIVRELQPSERKLAVAAESEIQKALVKTVPSLAIATAITVNGQDVVAVSDIVAAKTVRDSILEEYRKNVLSDAKEVEELAFSEQIDWHPKVIPSERVRSIEEAVNILKHGTDKLVTYEVKKDDTGWDIARSYNVSTDQLAQANPTVDIESLQIGQILNVTFRDPYVHTMSVSQKVVLEGIPFTEQVQKDNTLWPWQYQVVKPGTYGQRELTLREYRENGQIVKTEVIGNKVLKEPDYQIARVGTKQTPDLGTGSLALPVAGTITSYFGPRWGTYHYGLDLAAPTGTPVIAADSGMVVFRGWDGNYGYAVHIDHGGGRLVTWYAHLSAFNVSLGDTVKQGDVIGYVGNTGYSTGPHLHFEVHEGGTAVNPLKFYP